MRIGGESQKHQQLMAGGQGRYSTSPNLSIAYRGGKLKWGGNLWEKGANDDVDRLMTHARWSKKSMSPSWRGVRRERWKSQKKETDKLEASEGKEMA